MRWEERANEVCKQASKLSTHHDIIESNVIINLVYNISSEPTELAQLQFPHSVASGMQTCTYRRQRSRPELVLVQ